MQTIAILSISKLMQSFHQIVHTLYHLASETFKSKHAHNEWIWVQGILIAIFISFFSLLSRDVIRHRTQICAPVKMEIVFEAIFWPVKAASGPDLISPYGRGGPAQQNCRPDKLYTVNAGWWKLKLDVPESSYSRDWTLFIGRDQMCCLIVIFALW